MDGCSLCQLIVDFLRIDAEKPVPKDVPVKLRSGKTRAVMPAGAAGFIFGACFGDDEVWGQDTRHGLQIAVEDKSTKAREKASSF